MTDITIFPKPLSGTIHAIPSKSQAHRVLICAAFSDRSTQIVCPETNADIEATAACLRAIGANIQRTQDGYTVEPVRSVPLTAALPCGESGSTLRFLLPVVGALGIDAVFNLEGRLPCRPLSPLWEEMERMGCVLTRPTGNTVRCCGKLHPGKYSIAGNISSQFITGLLFAAALMDGTSIVEIIGALESRPYVDLTLHIMQLFGIFTKGFQVTGAFPFSSPGKISIEGDWSNGAFYLAAGALGNDIQVEGLDPNSAQGDRFVMPLLDRLDAYTTISASNIPDLIPILSVVAACKNGCQFTNIGRLRLKESDRVASVMDMLRCLGIEAYADENTLTVSPGKIQGGTVDSANDHRIAMSAAIAATVACAPVTILNADCVSKSYPTFWDNYKKVGGNYEQYIR